MVIVKRYSGTKFRTWLLQKGILQQDAAADLGVTKLTVCRICSGRQLPRDDLKIRIWQYTGGAVEPNDWFDLDPRHLSQPQPMGEAA